MNIIRSKWFLVVMIPVLGWLSLSFIKIKLHENLVNKEMGELGAKVEYLEKSNSSLEKLIGYLKNPVFLEKEVRSKLNYKALGEEVVFVYPDTSAQTGSVSVGFQKQLAQMPNYVKWVYYILGYEPIANSQ